MNFQKINPVESNKSMLDIAFRKAREKGQNKNLKGNWLQIIRQKEALKLDIIKDTLIVRLEKILENFPNESELPEFYVKLFQLTLDYPLLKTSFGAISWATKKIRFFHRDYVSKITKCKERDKIKQLSKEFYGRISSILKQISKNLQYLEEARKVMRTYPDVKEMFTVCIYGFPNVGKTTLLNKLTGTKAEVAAYAFTTKSINSGYFKVGEHKVQVLDVPGTLARKEKMNNIELQAELVMKELANLIVYVFDLSGHSIYSFKKQEQLFKNISKEKQVLVYLSKKDLLDKKTISEFKYKYYQTDEIKEKIVGFLN